MMQPSLELAAAQALLGVTPVEDEPSAAFASQTGASVDPSEATLQSMEDDFPLIIQRRPRSDSAGLDALADLATLAQSNELDTALATSDRSPQVHFLVSNEDRGASSSDDSEQSETLRSPLRRRRRSASNPEGMDKWDPRETRLSGRRHFVLPASILEEELAEVSEAMKKQNAERLSVTKNGSSSKRSGGQRDAKNQSNSNDQRDDEVDEASLTPDELLRRARSRLLEDLSCSYNGEKGELLFPHTLEKYQEIYNMNGRIGIYTAAERAAIIARFQRKRSRRVWNKKIRYGCRKSLADRRLRVKGRFVKRSEQEELARQLAAKQKNGEKENADEDEEEEDDKDMPDVNDEAAGFAPTDGSPYRRLRRYTIT